MDDNPDLAANVKRARFARSEHRARQHADAHAADAPAPPLHVIDHPHVPH